MSDWTDLVLNQLPPYALIALLFYRAGWRDGQNHYARQMRDVMSQGLREVGNTFEFREAAAVSSFERAQWTMAKNLVRRLAGKFSPPPPEAK